MEREKKAGTGFPDACLQQPIQRQSRQSRRMRYASQNEDTKTTIIKSAPTFLSFKKILRKESFVGEGLESLPKKMQPIRNNSGFARRLGLDFPKPMEKRFGR